MQKIGKKASILIWSIFLSLTLSITFISISTQINKSLKENAKIKENISINRNTEKIIKDAVINNNYDNIELADNQVIIFDKGNYSEKELKSWETVTIKVIDSTNITVQVTKWSPVEYSNLDNSKSWVVTSESRSIFYLSKEDSNEKTFTIKNLWWYSEIIISWEKPFQSEYKTYKIIEKIWNKNVTKENWKIKIF